MTRFSRRAVAMDAPRTVARGAKGTYIVDRVIKWSGRGGVTAHPALVVWGIGVAVILGSTLALQLWATRKTALYEALVVVAFSVWLWGVLPRLCALTAPKSLPTAVALALTGGYIGADFLAARHAITHAVRIKGDFAIFMQSLWWTLHGLPLFNTLEGTSHLGVHASFLLLALVPLYALWPSPLLLVLVQAVALGLGGLVVYRIARRYLDPLASLCLLAVFLLYPAYHYDFGDFYESSLAPPLIALTLDSALRGRYRAFAVWSLLLLSVKETFPLMLVLFGVYLLLARRWRPGLGAILLGGAWLYGAQAVVIPLFRRTYAVFPTVFTPTAFFAQFGGSPAAILRNVVMEPAVTAATVLQPGKPAYLLSLVAPYLIVGFAGSLLWIVALPELAISLLSESSARLRIPLLVGSRFAMVIAVSVALSAVLTLHRLSRAGVDEGRRLQRLVASAMLFSTLSLVPYWLSSTSLAPVARPAELRAIMARVGPAAPVAVPYNIAAPFAQRAIVLDIDHDPAGVVRSCARYVALRHDHQPRQVFAAIVAGGFRRAWSGPEFEVWRSARAPSCTPRVKPWGA